MPRKSSISRLPEDIRRLIGQLNDQGWTIDQIHAKLAELLGEAPSRSSVGRHLVGYAKIKERLTRSRTVAEALVRDLGDEPESRAAQLNIEFLHSAVFDLFQRSADGEVVDPDGRNALAGNPEGLMMLSKALDHLGKASKSSIEYVNMIETRATEKANREAVKIVESVGRERGISADTVGAIKAAIFGIKPQVTIEHKPA